MTRQQREAVDALLRDAPVHPNPTLAEQRAGFALALSRPLPDDVTVRETVLAGRPALDLTPATAAGRGRLLHFHGGGYILGSPGTHAGFTAQLARRAGLRATSLDYRLAPEHPFPAAVDDGLAAYRALLDAGVRPEELVLAGDSAGGGLVVATLVAARDAGLPQPAGAVVFSPWVDLTLGGESMRTKKDADPIFTPEAIRAYVAPYLGGQDPAHPLASPVFADLRGLPPLLVQAGSNELLLDDAVRLAGRAAADEVDVTLRVWPRVPHVFQVHFGSLDEADEALDEAALFLSARVQAGREADRSPGGENPGAGRP
ncbi:alpha/beta hydrolase [Microbispora rosea subsp. aerata]|nr:alpha/beta hydrolase [Microbispora rosea]GGO26441.1 alpha/beta hydrolase [Microbispora rosea subsp. aerata]GIH54225.1 alpha/beta hydrolase [Microbispora rosea subsp. aerata]GLJ83584.1 alpha/beta hydrolase [Microbispora rosea subsp. aerata]